MLDECSLAHERDDRIKVKESVSSVYSIKQVSEMLEIPTVTLRAWENRYGAVNPTRTESGYRVYSSENIEDLKWLKEQVEDKHMSISQAVLLLKEYRKEKRQVHAFSEPPVGSSKEAFSKMSDQIYRTLYQFQGERANGLIDFGFSMYGYDSMFYHVLVPVLIRVGDAWESGRATVAQEHFMTTLISQRFYQFFHLFPIYPKLPKVLSFCPEGEHHQVGLMLFSLFLRKNGVEVLYLGANTPLNGVLDMIGEQHVQLICISTMSSELVPESDAFVSLIARRYPDVNFILGGKGYESAAQPMHPDWVMKEPADKWQDWFETSPYFR